MPRFALSIHDSPRGLHYDLFLESGHVLKTWALSHVPEPGRDILGVALADHRLLYLDYEGPITGGRGTVALWDQGTFQIESWNESQIELQISGEKLAGRFEFRRQDDVPENWRIEWKT